MKSRRWSVRMLGWLLALPLAATAGGPVEPPKSGLEVYRKVAPNTVAFMDKDGAPRGSGVLVNAKDKIVLTAYHVVNGLGDDKFKVRVFFPVLEGKRVVTDAYEYARLYRKDPKSVVIEGRVLVIDPVKDLALVRLDSVPDDRAGIPLATDEPEPGEGIHVIGNSTGGRGGVFGYNRGYVRNAFLHSKDAFCFFALCHQSPTNRGDSGGPVVNDRGEVVAVISHGTTGSGYVEQVVDYSVHLRELHAFIDGKVTYKTPCLLPTRSHFGLKAMVKGETQTDMVYFPVRGGDKLSVTMKGNTATDLDLLLDPGLDHAGLNKVKRVGDTDQESVELQSDWTGPCRIKVVNYHSAAVRKEFMAKKLSPGPITRENEFVLETRSTLTGQGSVAVLRRISPGATDEIKLHYEAGKGTARISLIGQGFEDLDLYVIDPKKAKIAEAETFASRETVTFTPTVTGVYTIQVLNLDRRGFSTYFLITD